MTVKKTYNSPLAGNFNCSNVKIGSVPVPDYDAVSFYTCTPSDLSDDEWRNMIVAQAQKDQSQGKFQAESQEWLQLHNKFTSVASPDRKAIINSALTTIKNTKTIMGAIDFIKLWLNGRVIRDNDTIHVEYASFYDSNGKEIAFYAEGKGWSSIMTDAEVARLRELTNIYNEAWRAAAKGIGADNTPAGESQASVMQKESYMSVEQFSAYSEARKHAPVADNEAAGRETYGQYDFGYDEYEIKVDAVG